MKYTTLSGQSNEIKIQLERKITKSEKYNFVLIEIFEEDNINNFFHILEIDEQINLRNENKKKKLIK